LKAEGLRYESIYDFKYAASTYFDRAAQLEIDYEWFRENFDPFSDEFALERIVAALSAPLLQQRAERVSL
jgi:hypothetical protein